MAESTEFLLERHLKEFYDSLRQLSLHLAQQCLSHFGRRHWQLPALLTQAGRQMLPQHGAHVGTVSCLHLQNQHSTRQHQWEGQSGWGLTCSKAINTPRTLAVAAPCILALSPGRDRLRTMTNVLGDALAAGIIAHVCEKDFAPKPPPVRAARWEGRGSWDMAGQAQGTCSLQKLKLCSLLFAAKPSEQHRQVSFCRDLTPACQ